MGSPTKGARSYLWRVASAIGGLRFRATTSSPLMVQTTRCPTYSTILPHRVAAGSALIGIGAGCITSSRSGARRRHAAEIDEQYIEDPLRRMSTAPGRLPAHHCGGVGRVRSGNGGMAISEKAAAMT